MATVIDIVDGCEALVDQAVDAHKKITQFTTILNGLKILFRNKASKIIGVDDNSIKFGGKEGTVRVSFSRKMTAKPTVNVEDIPEELRDLFFTVETKYNPVENFQELAEEHPEILEYVELKDPTPSVSIGA